MKIRIEKNERKNNNEEKMKQKRNEGRKKLLKAIF